MILFALCINPLLIKLDSKLHGIKVRHNTTKTTAVAYADDITIFITHSGEIDVIKEIVNEYMNATGARMNEDKSSAIAPGSWTKTTPIMKIKYYEDIKILGFHMTVKINESAKKSWAMLTSKIRTHTQNAYQRALNLDYGIRYINEVILATAWYAT